MARRSSLTVYSDDETERLLRRIAAQEFRSLSSTMALLIRREAAARGMLGRAPELVPKAEASRAGER